MYVSYLYKSKILLQCNNSIWLGKGSFIERLVSLLRWKWFCFWKVYGIYIFIFTFFLIYDWCRPVLLSRCNFWKLIFWKLPVIEICTLHIDLFEKIGATNKRNKAHVMNFTVIFKGKLNFKKNVYKLKFISKMYT